MFGNIDERIKEFQARFPTEKDFCEELYRDATIKLLAAKYAYYVLSQPYLKDITYDLMEKSWYVMGRALGHLKEDETTPCVDWDEKHPLANEAIELANRLKGPAV
jgi:hypothetical protein